MDKQIEYAMNELINDEIWSVNLYLSLKVYFDEQNLPVLASWLSMQAQGNMSRIYRMMSKIYKYGGCVEIRGISREPDAWQSPMEALNKLMSHEQYMSQRIKALITLARNVAPDLYPFINHLYSHRVYAANILMEMLRVVNKENERRLPFSFSEEFNNFIDEFGE